MKLSLVAFFLVFLVESSLSAAITGKFAKNGTDYVCRVFSQSYHVDDKVLKIYGKHLKTKVEGTVKVFGNTNVTVFDASYKQNDIQKVPTTVLYLFPNLKEMKLEAMNLKVIDGNSFESCKNLRKLFFGKDNIEFIGSGVFKPCANLEEIVFNGSLINSIDDEAFQGLSQLRVLKLIGNNLTHISPELLKPLTELSELTITGNPIVSFDPDVFLALKNLRVLNLENNSLDSVSSQLFRFKEKLEKVNLSNNSIVTIDNRMLENWPNNAELDLSGNKCIDRNFGHLGTDELPMSDVVGYIKECYDILKVLELEKVNSNLENPTDNSNESAENKSTLYAISNETTSDSLEDIPSVNSTEVLSRTVVGNSTLTTVEEEADENLSNAHDKTFENEPFENQTNLNTSHSQTTQDIKNFEEDADFGEPIFFRDNVTWPEERTTDEGEANEDANDAEEDFIDSHESQEKVDTIISTTQRSSSLEEQADVVNNTTKIVFEGDSTVSMNGNISAANVSAIIEFEPIFNSSSIPDVNSNEANETFDGSGATDDESITNFGDVNITSGETANNSEITMDAEHDITSHASTTAKPYLHSYEQADCRFYVSAHNDYTCVLKNVKKTLKRINIKHIDDDFTNDNVTVLFIRDCDLLHIPRVIFDAFPHLKSLSVESCGIKSMDEELFEICGNLQKLDLSNNKIHRVKGNSLKMCPMLGFVDLSSNPVEKIESSIFECNPKLNISLGGLQIVSPSTKL